MRIPSYHHVVSINCIGHLCVRNVLVDVVYYRFEFFLIPNANNPFFNEVANRYTTAKEDSENNPDNQPSFATTSVFGL